MVKLTMMTVGMQKRIALVLFLLIALSYQAFSQIAPNKYFIQFTDKNNSSYSLDHPEAFLTARALTRRQAHGIAVEENDIPVNSTYVQEVIKYGAHVLTRSRWMNGVTIFSNDTAAIDSIENLPFVKRTISFKEGVHKQKVFFKNETSHKRPPTHYKTTSVTEKEYGAALTQIKQIDGIPLQQKGFRGQGMVIAILDAGYTDVPTQALFDSLRDEGRLLGTKNFVLPGGSVYVHYHGRMVLSCMAADIPGEMIGTAPKASYWLLVSEDASSENVIEEYNWVSAAEFADSVGADIINSSLGYIDFDDSTYSHPYSDMDGKTNVSTLGAEIAASKGILVVNSAGNNGQSVTFPWIGAPADGDSVFTIGAVDSSGMRAVFSSVGPTYDGRIKPTVMAMGQDATVANADSGVVFANGTSFSSPIMAGMSACLWQAHPQASNMQIIQALKETASYHSDPNNQMGWGIPDFAKADSLLALGLGIRPFSKRTLLQIYPNPFRSAFQIRLQGIRGDLNIQLYDLSGRMVYQKVYNKGSFSTSLRIKGLNWLNPGIYMLKAIDAQHVFYGKIVKE